MTTKGAELARGEIVSENRVQKILTLLEKRESDAAKDLELKMEVLTEKQKLFVLEYIKDGNGSRSVRDAGFTGTIGSCDEAAWRLLGNTKVRDALNAITRIETGEAMIRARFHSLAVSGKAEMTQLHATDRLARIAGMYTAGDEKARGGATVNIVNINLPEQKREPKNMIVDIEASVGSAEDISATAQSAP